MQHPSTATASLFAALGAILMGTIGIFARMVEASSDTVTFFRLLFGALCILIILGMKGRVSQLRQRPPLVVVLSGMCLSLLIIFYLKAIASTTMANAVLLIYFAPLIASVLAHFFLKERLTLINITSILLSIFGFLLLMELKFDLNSFGATGFVNGLASAFFYALYILLNRVIPVTYPSYSRSFWQMASGALLMLPFVAVKIPSLPATDYPWLIAVGVFPGFLAIISVVIALQTLSTAAFGTLSYLEPIAVAVFGWTLFHEVLSPMQITGGLVIVGAGVFSVLYRKQKPQQVVAPAG